MMMMMMIFLQKFTTGF